MMNNIRKLRIHAKLTQKELAENSGMDLRYLRRIETGEFPIENVTLKKLMAIANCLCVNPWELLNND